MSLNMNDKLYGFTVTRVRASEELGGAMVEMIHDKTGASLCWVDNGEDNKLFCIGFKTLPEDSTGVFHILEHSVLCGSAKYPVREPFVELLKSSMNTFLNAMTFPDKTIYPVSSRNGKDFLNLTSVYLDAVFAPRLLEDPNIFYQEGWHTEVNDGTPSYKGVVFNEMKGAMSGVDDIVDEQMNALLFPDNCYRFNSGGAPAAIPNLTYEHFVESYKRFYHPSNARIFLDGSIPLEDTLAMIDEYLSAYECSDETHEIPMQQPKAAEGVCCYEIGEGEDGTDKVYYTTGKIVGTWEDKDKFMAAEVLCDLLADSNESPLKRAILSAGLGEDVRLGIMDGIAQPYLIFQVRNTSADKVEAIRATLRETVEGLLEKGLDRSALEASINHYAFRIRQEREPQGLLHAINAMSGWLYGGDPMLYLTYNESVAALRKMLEGDGYEKLLRELLLDEQGLVTLLALPSADYGAQQRRRENDRLAAEAAARSEADWAGLEELNRSLAAWQQTPDSPEQLATLPVLPLSEVGDEPERVESEETVVDGVTVLRHRIPSKGIAYLNLYFSLADCTLEELTRISLLPELLGNLSTDKYSAVQLQQQIKTYIGSLRFRIDVMSKGGDTLRCKPCLGVYASVLEENWEIAVELICEILLHTHIDQPDRIREIVMQADEMGKQMGIMAGHQLGVRATAAHYSAQGAVMEALQGHTRISWLHTMAKDFDSNSVDVIALMERVCARALCRSRLTVGITTTGEMDISPLLSALPQGEPAPEATSYRSDLPRRMGIRIPAQAAFAVQSWFAGKDGRPCDGSLQIADNILSLGYLWNEIRVQGGAYGAGMQTTRHGGMFCYTYRDPSPARSLSVYGGASDFLKEFCAGEEDLDKFIISAVAGTEPLIAPGERGLLADGRWISGFTYADLREHRRQMLSTTREKLLEWCGVLETMSRDGAVCVVGHDEALKLCPDIEIRDL